MLPRNGQSFLEPRVQRNERYGFNSLVARVFQIALLEPVYFIQNRNDDVNDPFT